MGNLVITIRRLMSPSHVLGLFDDNQVSITSIHWQTVVSGYSSTLLTVLLSSLCHSANFCTTSDLLCINTVRSIRELTSRLGNDEASGTLDV